MGRKLEFKERRTVSTYLEASELEALNDIRWRERKAMSDIIRLAIVDYIKAHGSGNETFRLDNWNEDPEFQAVPTVFTNPDRWTAYVDQCDKKERLKLLKAVSFVKHYVDSRI